eukprot:12922647-Prorocentrum_lima.AAC.1
MSTKASPATISLCIIPAITCAPFDHVGQHLVLRDASLDGRAAGMSNKISTGDQVAGTNC